MGNEAAELGRLACRYGLGVLPIIFWRTVKGVTLHGLKIKHLVNEGGP